MPAIFIGLVRTSPLFFRIGFGDSDIFAFRKTID